MAKLSRSFVRLRFRFGEENVKGRQRYENSAAYLARRVAFSYAEDQYVEMRKSLEHGVASDVRRELVNLASLYRRHIIGANGNTTRPAGVIRSVIGGAEPLTLSSALPAWAPRDAKYVRRKIFNRAGAGWFDNRAWRGRGAPEDSGLLFREMRADTWETMFGPIRVRFYKSHKLTADDARATFNTGKGKNIRVQIGTISVVALNKVTPQMLPGLAAGTVGMASDEGNDGLMGLVKSYDERLAYRLGQRSTVTKRYRPTLEPFLTYFLTRSIPSAIERRIAEGSLGRITRA